LIWTPDGQRLLAGISDFNSTLAQIVLAPPPCVNLQSPWPRLGRKRGSFGGSADRPGLLPGSTLALLPTGGLLNAQFAVSPGRYPFGTGSAAILLNMLPKRCRVRCPSASNSQ
jgi:hypothetical protein